MTKEDIKSWVEDGLHQRMVKECEDFAEVIKDMTTSQIRKFFGEVKRIEANFTESKDNIFMLAPRLAYSCGRKGGDKIKPFYDILKPALKSISTQDDKQHEKFKRFVKVLECIVAFHKEKAKS
ncbi:MAG: type III-A CRISPR-associated protein Csm2 [Bacteroidia bacterium]|nr:type III-A CRISPR-associated protein Csm2 [Bacteroidia bacterium]